MHPNTRDTVLQGTYYHRGPSRTIFSDAKFGTGNNANNPNEPHNRMVLLHYYFKDYYEVVDPPWSHLRQEVCQPSFWHGKQ